MKHSIAISWQEIALLLIDVHISALASSFFYGFDMQYNEKRLNKNMHVLLYFNEKKSSEHGEILCSKMVDDCLRIAKI